MNIFTITYAMTGGIEIEAKTEERARELFYKIPEHELYENAMPTEITDVFVDEE